MRTTNNIDLQLITSGTSSNSDGDLLYFYLINKALDSQIIIEIKDNYILSTSFLNSSFGRFISEYGFDLFKSNVKIKTNIATFNRLKNYVDIYSELYVLN